MIEGRCTCGEVRYRLAREPIVVHCCHCRWCQRETGSAFVVNAVIETEHLKTLGHTPELVQMPTASGKGQKTLRCPTCRVALWSHYAGGGDAAAFVRVGTMDDPDTYSPDVHIYTDSKQPWVNLANEAEQFAQFYSGKDVVRIYGESGAARWRALRAG